MEQIRYEANIKSFNKIPGSPIAYWVSEKFRDIFAFKNISDYAQVKTGMSTGNNDLYLRLWQEVCYNKIKIGEGEMAKINLAVTPWIPYNKGGDARKWYGNNEYIVFWRDYEKFHRPRLTYSELFLKNGVTWSFVTTGMFSARYYDKGFLWDVAGSPCVSNDISILHYIVALLSTKIARDVLKLINPTLNCQVVDIQRVPLKYDETMAVNIDTISEQSIQCSKSDWDSFETSWDFKKHPLI